jgi:uncharacterized protein YkwD
VLAAIFSACAAWLTAGARAGLPMPLVVVKESGPHSHEGCSDAHLLPTASDAPRLEQATLCLIDRERVGHHLLPLRANHALARVAAEQLTAMVRLNYFSDVRPSGRTPLSLVSGTRYAAHAARYTVGENIAWGSAGDATPASIVAAWMASPPHRQLILTREFSDAGVAASPTVPRFLGLSGVAGTYAIEFGSRRR